MVWADLQRRKVLMHKVQEDNERFFFSFFFFCFFNRLYTFRRERNCSSTIEL